MARFRIHYWCPYTGGRKVTEREFEDTKNGAVTAQDGTVIGHFDCTAEEWAEDCAYGLADKNLDYEIERLPDL